MNQQQADAIRRENENNSRAAWQKFNNDSARVRAESDARHQASERAASQQSHNERMRNYQQTGQTMRSGVFSSSSRRQSSADSGYSGTSSGSAKSKGGGFAVIILVVIIGIALSNGSSSKTARSGSADDTGISSAPTASAPPSQAQPSLTYDRPPAGVPVQPSLEVNPAPIPTASSPYTGANPIAASPSEPTPVTVPTTLPPPTLEVKTKVSPKYPILARQAGASGTIEVVVGVAPDGSVVNAFTAKGNPILTDAATRAAKQWVFYPYEAQPGEPLRTTSIDFRFDPSS